MNHSAHAGHGHAHGCHGGGDAVAFPALKDPVCGMTVTPQSPHRAEFEGRPVYDRVLGR